MNKVLKLLTLSDICSMGGFGLLAPIFAIYIVDNVTGGSILAVGIAATIYELTKAIVQIPVSKYTDKDEGNAREFNMLVLGSVVIAVVPLFYLAINDVSQLFLVQLILGVGNGFCYPGWMAIFTKFADKGCEGYCWSLYNTYTTISIAVVAITGAYIADNFGFQTVFHFMFFFSFLSTLLILKMHRYIQK